MGYVTLKKAHDVGVNIAYGTDCFSAMQPVQLSEFDLRAKVLPSPAVLKHATCNAGTSFSPPEICWESRLMRR